MNPVNALNPIIANNIEQELIKMGEDEKGCNLFKIDVNEARPCNINKVDMQTQALQEIISYI